jgi:3-hydroxyacyl-[acyl-carrier-protein] dehydratase
MRVGYYRGVSSLSLPLDYAAITRILPHRYPFLLVDRITEFEPDTRILGIKNVTASERYLSPPDARGERVLPPIVLTEAVAQVGGILILSKPENAGHLIFFRGIERARFRGAARPGDAVAIEARVIRLRSRMGVLTGEARVGDRVLVRGTMTFALGPRSETGDGVAP